MRLRPLIAFLFALLLLGCPPSLRNADDDDLIDDDDVADDDDDLVDDDDDIAVDCARSPGFIEMWSSAGASFEGTWFYGDVDIQQGLVTVTDAAGQVTEFSNSFFADSEGFVPGPGAVYWQTPGNAPFNQDAILAIDLWEPMPAKLVLGNMAVPNEELSDAFGVWVEPLRQDCGEPEEVECGVARGLPLFIYAWYPDGSSDEVWLGSGDASETEWGVFIHLGGQIFDEVFCPDVPAEEYAWVWGSSYGEPVLGIR